MSEIQSAAWYAHELRYGKLRKDEAEAMVSSLIATVRAQALRDAITVCFKAAKATYTSAEWRLALDYVADELSAMIEEPQG